MGRYKSRRAVALEVVRNSRRHSREVARVLGDLGPAKLSQADIDRIHDEWRVSIRLANGAVAALLDLRDGDV